MESIGAWFGRHFVAPFTMFRDAGFLGLILACLWLMYPFAMQTVIHPSDAVGFQAYIQGLPISQYVTQRALLGGLALAVIALGCISLMHFVVLLLIYRRVQYAFSCWFVALVLIGGVANGLWYLRTGYFDLLGALAGLTPLVLMVGLEGVFERLGQDFVFGKGERPYYQ
jgi:hypothetical protein